MTDHIIEHYEVVHFIKGSNGYWTKGHTVVGVPIYPLEPKTSLHDRAKVIMTSMLLQKHKPEDFTISGVTYL